MKVIHPDRVTLRIASIMKILIISPFFPSETSFHGGGQFLFEMIEHLCRRHQIGLVAFVNEKDLEDSFDRLKNLCGPIRTIQRDIFHVERRKRLVNVFSPFPSWFLHTNSDRMRVSIEALLKSFSPDIVQLEFLGMAHYVKGIRHPSVVLNIHEAFGRAWMQRALENGERVKVPYLLWDYWKMARFERKLLHRFKAVLTFSDEDRRYLLSKNPKACVNVWTRAMKVGPEPESHAPPEKEQRRLLFVGSFHHTPNIDAIGFFCEEIFPKILNERGRVVLDIIGANPPDSVKRYQGPHVHVHGYVEKLDPYYKNADVVVVPVRFGGGSERSFSRPLPWDVLRLPPSPALKELSARMVYIYLSLRTRACLRIESSGFSRIRCSVEPWGARHGSSLKRGTAGPAP